MNSRHINHEMHNHSRRMGDAMFKYACLLLVGLFIVGCQSTPQGPLAPQEFAFNADKTRTKEAIIATFLPRGYQIVRDSEFQLVMDRPARDNVAAQFIYGSKFNIVPNARVVLTITGDKPTKVHSQIQIVTNPGSGFEQINDFNNNPDGRQSVAIAMAQVQALLSDG